MPVVLLIGPDTASAAEVFAAALHSNDRGRLIGRPTYGKCTTQTEVTLSDGSVLRFTNGRILAPEGRQCHAQGLRPDVLVPENTLHDLQFLLEQTNVHTSCSYYISQNGVGIQPSEGQKQLFYYEPVSWSLSCTRFHPLF